MDYNLFFKYDYFRLKNIEDENEFFNVLNQDEHLVGLVDSFLSKIKEAIFNNINKKNFNVSDYADTKTDLQQIIKEIDRVLITHPLTPKDAQLRELVAEAFSKFEGRISQLDRMNTSQYVLQSYISLWLETRLADLISIDHRFADPLLLERLLAQTELLFTFYSKLKGAVPKAWIEKNEIEWTTLAERPQDILKYLTTYEKEYFNDYERIISQYSQENPWKFVLEATRNADAAHLSSYIAFKSSVLLRLDIREWIVLWDNLRFPVLQEIMLFAINRPTDLIRISDELATQGKNLKSNSEHLCLILLKHLFESGVMVSQKLSFYEDVRRLGSSNLLEDSSFVKQGREAKAVWINGRAAFYKTIFGSALKILRMEILSDFVFHYSLRGGDSVSSYNSEVDFMVSAYKGLAEQMIALPELIEELSREFNFSKFNFLVSLIRSGILTDNQIDLILLKFLDFSGSKSFYWDGTYSPPYWATLKGIGYLLSEKSDTSDTIKRFVSNVKICHEGWNVKEPDYNETQRELFWLCAIGLTFEHSNSFHRPEDAKEIF
ncbi:MAG TPA: hypothetical protein VGQ59_21825, partial [Cyclobacteriaceae bacterium]|nr:hypothetical protein [Cyclobacteriaceae bacterium]